MGGLLLWAAISKLANPTDFLASIQAYPIPLPPPLLKGLAMTLPWVELLCALLLLANLWTRSALLCGLILFLVFTVATGQAWARGRRIFCGCFDLGLLGMGSRLSSLQAVLKSVSLAFFRNILLTGLVAWLWRGTGSSRTASSSSEVLPVNEPSERSPVDPFSRELKPLLQKRFHRQRTRDSGKIRGRPFS